MKLITPAASAASEILLHPAHHQPHIKPISAPLHVIAVISNPMRYESRYRLYRAFEKMVADSGAILTTVELALRDSHFHVTDHHNPRHVQLRSPSILWHKENMINLGIRHLPADWEYLAWIDADVAFGRPDWAAETVHLLQTYDVIQMWTHSVDLGPAGQPIANCTSLVTNWLENEAILQPWDRGKNKPLVRPGFTLNSGGLLHTGYAWAARRSTLAELGGLGEIGILGSGDRHMAYAFLGEVERSFPAGIHPTYKQYWREWQVRADAAVAQNVGVMAGTLYHNWHGAKAHRRYQDRWQILVNHQYDWTKDIKHDVQGILTWTHHNRKLERDVRNYFAVRNEDSTDL